MTCRHCSSPLTLTFLDLGSAPLANAYLSTTTLQLPEPWYPLRLLVCTTCWLVQTEDHASREAMFTDDYAYFSSFSASWLRHAEAYVNAMTARFGLGSGSLVTEIGANDGYLLRYVQQAGIPCYGVEPTAGTAAAARDLGLDIVQRFFGAELSRELVAKGWSVDLAAANNVLAHVPDINDFVAGFALLLKADGVATFEFPHLLRMVEQSQFDTAYHEHFSYLSLTAVERIFRANGLAVFDVEELATHGGSLRVFAQRRDGGVHASTDTVAELLDREAAAGLTAEGAYATFQAQADRIKNDFMAFLIETRRAGQTVAAYGAAAKGNTLMNYAGVRPDLLPFVVDSNPAKQGRFLPGSRIPIVAEERLRASRPDFVVLLPWNLKDELVQKLDYIRAWGGNFVTAVPGLEIQ